jgi:hypothetical protein
MGFSTPIDNDRRTAAVRSVRPQQAGRNRPIQVERNLNAVPPQPECFF